MEQRMDKIEADIAGIHYLLGVNAPVSPTLEQGGDMDVMHGTFGPRPSPSTPPPPEDAVYYAIEEDMTTPSRPRQETTRRPLPEESFLPDTLPLPVASSTPAPKRPPTPARIETVPDISLCDLPPALREKYRVRSAGIPHKYALIIFKHHVPYTLYCEWVFKVNYDGNRHKKALPANLRKKIVEEMQRYYPVTDPVMRGVRDCINGVLRHARHRPWMENGEDFQ
ncbi:hypothetical protein FKM82_027874 [Ascaphus truei]